MVVRNLTKGVKAGESKKVWWAERVLVHSGKFQSPCSLSVVGKVVCLGTKPWGKDGAKR
jgi:hypothetical protein